MTIAQLSGPDHTLMVRAGMAHMLAMTRRGMRGAKVEDLSAYAAVEAAAALLALVGQTETPRKSNRGPTVALLRQMAGRNYEYKPGDDPWGAWCAYAAAGAWGLGIRSIETSRGLDFKLVTPTSGGVARWWHKAVESGHAITARDTAEIRVGDAWLRDDRPDDVRRGGKGDGGHTGLVAGFDTLRQIVYTVEGNTDMTGWDTNGGAVACKSIAMDDPRLVGFVRLEVRV